MDDITIDVNGYRVNLRVGAIITQGDEVLMCHMAANDWWFLPGGRIKTGESSLIALQRELTEEIGESYRIIRPAICSENFFEEHGRQFHEICTYYEVEWLGGRGLNPPRDAPEIFQWVPKTRVYDMDLKPDFVKDYIANPRRELELVIHRDGEGPRQQNA